MREVMVRTLPMISSTVAVPTMDYSRSQPKSASMPRPPDAAAPTKLLLHTLGAVGLS